MLKHISGLIGGRLRSTDLLCRMGGEEFAVMVANVALPQVEHLTRELQTVVAKTPSIVDAAELRVTFSAGIAQLGSDGDDLRACSARLTGVYTGARRRGASVSAASNPL